jgi:protein arginine kinase activator
MLCDICKQNVAKVHLTQIIEGKTKKIDLCEDCSKAKGIDDPTGFSLADLLLGLGASQEMEQASAGAGGLVCPSCGFTQADFRKSGRLGCARCYETFSEGLEGLLKTMHKGVRHTGKCPSELQSARDFKQKLDALQQQLDRAVGSEDFEEAAVLRDEIKRLREQLGAAKGT